MINSDSSLQGLLTIVVCVLLAIGSVLADFNFINTFYLLVMVIYMLKYIFVNRAS